MIGNFNLFSAAGMAYFNAVVNLIIYPFLFVKNKIKWIHGFILTAFQLVFAALFSAGMASLQQWKFSYVGVAFYGAIFTLWIIPLIYTAITKLDYKKVLDTIVPMHMLTICINKIGCSIADCCYGIEINGARVPIQLIESAVAFVLFILLVVFQKKIQGIAYPVMLVSYGTVRFIEEFFRWHEKEYFGFMSIGQIWSILAFVIGLALLLAHYFVGRKKAKAIS